MDIRNDKCMFLSPVVEEEEVESIIKTIIDHNILLEVYGIWGPALSWLKTYLSNKKQFVSFNDVNSEYLDEKCGIPQGSIIGPTLFILYINDLHNVSKILNCILFADDTNIFLAGKK